MKFENAIICDEVRVEDTGKHIIIGVYSESIAVSDFPANLLLSFWIQFYVDRDGEIDIELRILSNKKQVAHARGKLIINDYKNIVTSAFNGIPVKAKDEGALTFQMREKDRKWKTFKKIVLRKSTT